MSLATFAAFALTAALLVGTIFPRTNDLLAKLVLQTIAAEANGLREQFNAGGLAGLRLSLTERTKLPGTSLYFLKGSDGRKLGGNLSRVPPEIDPASKGGSFTYSAAKRAPRNPNLAMRQRLAVGVIIDVPGGAQLVVARDIDDQRQFANTVKWAMYGGFALLLLIGLGGGLLVSRHSLQRIEAVSATAKTIMDGDLSGRIPLSGSGDELDRLSVNLNAMLERIEQLMAGLREVSDNIAHDLKTPLNRLRNRAEAALRDPAGKEAYREGLVGIIEQADELIMTFNALLSIARLEAGAITDDLTPVDLADVVRDVGELYEPVADESGFHLNVFVTSGAIVNANRQLMGQAVANLIDNAIKYSISPYDHDEMTPAAQLSAAIDLQLKVAKNQIVLSVGDHGPGIPAAERARALKRFVRLEASRSQPGSGLGLALVSAVVQLHGGTIRLADNKPGLKVVITLPAAPVASVQHHKESRLSDNREPAAI